MGNFYHKFSNKAAEATAAATSVSDPYISYIEATGEVNFGYKNKSVALGDYLHSDGKINSTASSDVIGVCVIASNFLPDGKARFVSIKAIDGTASGSTSNKYIYWYDGKEDYSAIYNNELYTVVNDRAYDRVPVDSNTDGVLDIFDDNASWGRLPMDRTDSGASSFNIDNPLDSGTKYYSGTTSRIPSPYTNSGTLNPNYMFQGSVIGHRNCLQDIYGDRNTETLVKHPHSCQPAEFCRKFAPGYRDGEWYLPAIGELAFLAPRCQFINTKISAAISAGAAGVVLPFSYFWSSSEYSQYYAWRLGLYNGNVSNDGKDGLNSVRAFIAS